MVAVAVKMSVQIPGGPTVEDAPTILVEAYTAYEISVAPGKTAEVAVLPADVKGQVKIFVIQSSLYKKSDTEKITYKIDSGDEQDLDAPQLFLGSSAIDKLGPPQKITFKNDYPVSEPVMTEDDPPKPKKDENGNGITKDLTEANTAKITILVGRDAAPAPPPASV